MTKANLSRRLPLDRASRATLGANFGVVERIGLHIPGVSLSSR